MYSTKQWPLTWIWVVCLLCPGLYADDGYGLWLKYPALHNTRPANPRYVVLSGQSETLTLIKNEIRAALGDLPFSEQVHGDFALVVGTPMTSPIVRGMTASLDLKKLGGEGFTIQSRQVNGSVCTILAANREIGLLYGTFSFLSLLERGHSPKDLNIRQVPKIRYRLLNHWDNPDGSVERGYAGRSLWFPEPDTNRLRDYARANASLGINGTVLNNVNADPILLTEESLQRIKTLADLFRPYGLRVYLSIRFSSPMSGDRGGIGSVATADPLNPEVRLWWKDTVAEIYRLIPDFGGFLVKANSEGMPGPQGYGRTHAQGANMLAKVLAPYRGIVMWRAFVYDEQVDPDRAKRAYKEFKPLDGQFEENCMVQVKNGPIDFQPREPVNPLFGAMPRTPLMLELQITQEYLGHANHLVYLAPQWKETLTFDTQAKGRGSTVARIVDGSLQHYRLTGIAGVANTGTDRNWCGHFFSQANWYAFGRLAWDPDLDAGTIAEQWIEMTFGRDPQVINTVIPMMMDSWEACVNYMTPLGLHHIMEPDVHYGPGPDYAQAPREDWNSVYYHRADADGVGFDRTATGSNAVAQYFPPVRRVFGDPDLCPEKYLLWFHHVPWHRRMASSRTLWAELCIRYNTGVRTAERMQRQWSSLKDLVDPEIFAHVQDRLSIQARDARTWAGTCTQYFQGINHLPFPGLSIR